MFLSLFESFSSDCLWRFKLTDQKVDLFKDGIGIFQNLSRHCLVGTTINHDVVLALGIKRNQGRSRTMQLINSNQLGIDMVFLKSFTHELTLVVSSNHPDKPGLGTRPSSGNCLVGTLTARSGTLGTCRDRLTRHWETLYVVGRINVDAT